MASALLQKTPYAGFGGSEGGILSKYQGKDLSSSVMDKEELPLTVEELAKSLAEKDAIGPPTVGPVSIDPTDWLTPGGLAKIGALLKGVLAPAAAVSTAMLVGSRAAGPTSQLARSLPEEMGAIVGHASPYKFSRFDSSKLKTGQGATSYGAGTYLAEHPAVIKEYEKEMLGKKASVIGSIDAQLSVYKTLFKDKTLDVRDRSIALERIKHYEAEKVALEAKYIPTSYKVDLPDEQIAKMLDWDKQSIKSTDPLALELKARVPTLTDSSFNSGNRLYKDMADRLGAVEASKTLNALGIPGIKYLDQRSRSVGEGTSNFVVFEPELLKILESEAIK